jgi:hypothetical protein
VIVDPGGVHLRDLTEASGDIAVDFLEHVGAATDVLRRFWIARQLHNNTLIPRLGPDTSRRRARSMRLWSHGLLTCVGESLGEFCGWSRAKRHFDLGWRERKSSSC